MNWMGIAVGGVVALIVGMQLLMWIKAKRSVGTAAPDTSSVDGPACADKRRLYYFYSASCGPCRAIKPLVEKLRQSHRNLIPVDVAQTSTWPVSSGSRGRPASSWSRKAPSEKCCWEAKANANSSTFWPEAEAPGDHRS